VKIINKLMCNANIIYRKNQTLYRTRHCQNFTTDNIPIKTPPRKTKKEHETKYLNLLKTKFLPVADGYKKTKNLGVCLIKQTETHIIIRLLCWLLFLLFLLGSCWCCTSCICSSCNWCCNSKLAGVLFDSSM
jgi:hypothetical protein